MHLLRLSFFPQYVRVVLDVVLENRLPLLQILAHEMGTVSFMHRCRKRAFWFAFEKSLGLERLVLHRLEIEGRGVVVATEGKV